MRGIAVVSVFLLLLALASLALLASPAAFASLAALASPAAALVPLFGPFPFSPSQLLCYSAAVVPQLSSAGFWPLQLVMPGRDAHPRHYFLSRFAATSSPSPAIVLLAFLFCAP